MTNPKKLMIKLVNPFYTYHPDFVQHDDGTYEELPTGSWVAEWTIQEHGDPIQKHYVAKFTTEDDAAKCLKTIADSCYGDSLYKWTTPSSPVFKLGTLTTKVKNGKPLTNDHW